MLLKSYSSPQGSTLYTFFYNNILSNENIGKGGTSRTAKNQRASDGPSTPPGLGYPVSPVVRFVAAVTLSLVPSY